MIFYDFEVFKYDWLAVFIDTDTEKKHVIINNPEGLKTLYEAHSKDIWVGFNNKHYDQYILKSILLGMNPKEISDFIIVKHGEGWQYSNAFREIPMINYDVMPNPPVGLKTLEAFLGSSIKETDVPFDLDRKLTEEEIQQTVFYCTHDVEETIKVFLEKISDFNAVVGILEAFPDRVNLSNIGDSEARITAKVLDCRKREFNDEFDYFFLPCLRIEKYKAVLDWFSGLKGRFLEEYGSIDNDHWMQSLKQKNKQVTTRSGFYQQDFTMSVAGIPHTFGFGGLHGAADRPVHYKGAIYHVDVNNYYPSMLIAWGLVTRARGNENYTKVYMTRKGMKMEQLKCAAAGDKAGAKSWKKKQLPYKKMLNALSGAMKDKNNPAYDPLMNNVMCINGQLMLLDLIEHLETGIEGFTLIQSNTDGLIVQIPDTQEAFEQLDDICYEWECRCSTPKCDIALALDSISEIFQKDVNNYLWVDADGGVERIGTYVKELSRTDNDLPILNRAIVEYMVNGTPVEKTIGDCEELIEFQKVVKLSDKYAFVSHEHCDPVITHTGKKVIKVVYSYPNAKRYTYKSYRVFASKDMRDGRLLRNKPRKKGEKFGNTPEHCFIFNDECCGVKVPEKLDKQWYINLAKKRLKDFGLEVDG